MRRWLLILIPLVLLVLLIVLGRALAGQHMLIDGTAGAVIYAAGFSGEGGFNTDWDQYDDGQLSARIADESLTIGVGRGGAAAFSSAAPHAGNFDLRVTLAAIAGPVDNGFGVLFRLQDGGNTTITDDAYYAFQISSDGYYRLVRRIEGAEREISTWIASDVVRQGLGAVNTLRVIAQGDSFQFFINDQPAPLCIPDDPTGRSVYFMETCRDGRMVTTWTDNTIATGQFGVLALATDTGGPGVVVRVDHLVVLGV